MIEDKPGDAPDHAPAPRAGRILEASIFAALALSTLAWRFFTRPWDPGGTFFHVWVVVATVMGLVFLRGASTAARLGRLALMAFGLTVAIGSMYQSVQMLLPLFFIGAAAVGLTRTKYRGRAIAVMIVLGLILGAYAFLLAPGRAAKLHDLLEADPAQVKRILLSPRDPAHEDVYPSLSKTPVEISDRAQIEGILRALKESYPFSPNHPHGKWYCVLELDYGDRQASCVVSSTSTQANGLLLYIYSGRTSGWVLGTRRQDALEPLLRSLLATHAAR